MRKISLIFIILSLCSCANITPSKPASISQDTYTNLSNYQGHEYYQACMVLGELVLDDPILQDIRTKIAAQASTDLCHTYLLAKKTRESHDVQRYLQHFPSGKAQLTLWKTHFEAGFPIRFVSPYIDLVNLYAKDNQLALDKLISAIPYVDASFSELLTDRLAEIYQYQPTWVLQRLKAQAISDVQIELIIRQAAYHHGEP